MQPFKDSDTENNNDQDDAQVKFWLYFDMFKNSYTVQMYH